MKKSVLITVAIMFIAILSFEKASAQTTESNIKVLNESNFKASTKTGIYVVDFYADWCRPCKMMKPVLEEVAGEYSSKFTIASVNTDQNKTLSSQYNISGIPCLVILKDGKEVKRIVGYRDKTQLLSELADYIN
jgi:thioredoxin 1